MTIVGFAVIRLLQYLTDALRRLSGRFPQDRIKLQIFSNN